MRTSLPSARIGSVLLAAGPSAHAEARFSILSTSSSGIVAVPMPVPTGTDLTSPDATFVSRSRMLHFNRRAASSGTRAATPSPLDKNRARPTREHTMTRLVVCFGLGLTRKGDFK